MATLKQSDIIKKSVKRGRPSKPDKERLLKQRAAYQWRDARRIYLASAFDRWRKLRSRLQLKDSSLAWHLLEAHDKDCSRCSTTTMGEGACELENDSKDASNKFQRAVGAMLRQLCHKHLTFDDSVVLEALVCVEVDRKTKVRYSIKEEITKQLKSEPQENHEVESAVKKTSVTASDGAEEVVSDGSNTVSEQVKELYDLVHPQLTSTPLQSTARSEPIQSSCAGNSASTHLTTCASGESLSSVEAVAVSVSEPTYSNECQAFTTVPTKVSSVSTVPQLYTSKPNQNYDETDNSLWPTVSGSFKQTSATMSASTSTAPVFSASKSWLSHSQEARLHEPHEKVVVSHDGTSRIVHSGPASGHVIRIDLDKHPGDMTDHAKHALTVGYHDSPHLDDDDASQDTADSDSELEVNAKPQDPMTAYEALHLLRDSVIAAYPNGLCKDGPVSNGNTSGMADADDGENDESDSDLPLDMSLPVRMEEDLDHQHQDNKGILSNTDGAQPSHRLDEYYAAVSSQDYLSHVKASNRSSDAGASTDSMQHLKQLTDQMLPEQFLTHASQHLMGDVSYSSQRKRSHSEMEDGDDDGDGGQSGLPDHLRKEAYKMLETNPFLNCSELSKMFPRLNQRTFYRWKRNLKSKFVFLESHPSMTFAQFRQHFPSFKEHIFNAWRRLRHKGHHFTADGSKSSLLSAVETAAAQTISIINDTSSQESEVPGDLAMAYYTLQKNFTLKSEQFMQIYPQVTKRMFQEWRTSIVSDFLKLKDNPTISYQEFRKQVNITKDTFDNWRTFIENSPLLKASSSLASAPTSQCSSTPALPSVNLLAAGSSKSFNTADLAAWYSAAASYGSLMGQIGVPFWPHLSLMSGSSLHKLEGQSAADLDAISRSHLTQDQNVDVETVSTKREKQMGEDTDGEDADSSFLADGGGSDGLVGHCTRRRLSLKPEHYYYLQHPDISYLGLAAIYPGVSAQRFNSWRRKVSSALAFLTRQPNVSNEEFALAFPNVPTDVLLLWRQRVQLGQVGIGTSSGQEVVKEEAASALATATNYPQMAAASYLTSHSASPSQASQRSHESSVEPETGDDAQAQEGDHYSRLGMPHQDSSSARKHFKADKEEFQFVMLYPSIDHTTFKKRYPHVKVRTFYRWRSAIRKALDRLRDDPSLGLNELKEIVPEATEEVVAGWKMEIQHEGRQASEGQSGPSTLSYSYQEDGSVDDAHHQSAVNGAQSSAASESVLSSSSTVQQVHAEKAAVEDSSNPSTTCSQAQSYVHLNPHIDFDEFTHSFPDVSKSTFQVWKTEMTSVMSYMGTNPSIRYEDLASVLPHISQEAYLLWKHVLFGEGVDDDWRNSHQQEAGSQQADGHSSSVSVDSSDAAGGGTVGDLQASRDSDLECMARAYHNQLAAQQSLLQAGLDKPAAGGKQRCQKEELIQVMLKPSMDHKEYAATLGGVSQRTFYRWKASIKLWREALAANPTMSYTEFTKDVTKDVPQHVFEVWQAWVLQSPPLHTVSNHSEQSLPGTEGQYKGQSTSAAVTSSAVTSAPSQNQVDDFSVPDDPSLAAAQDLLQHYPEMLYEQLATHCPSVTPQLYQDWQKCIAMRIEYIRLIRVKTFEQFRNIFKTIKEEVFNIWKDIVLRQTESATAMQNNFLYPETSESEASYQQAASGPEKTHGQTHSVSQSYTVGSSEYYQQASVYATSGTAHVEAPYHSYGSHHSGSLAAYSAAAHTTTSHSPHMQSISPSVRSDSRSSEVHVKVETSPSTPLPSFTETVSNLSSRSAHRQLHNPQLCTQLNFSNPAFDASSTITVKTNMSPGVAVQGTHSPAAVQGAHSPASVAAVQGTVYSPATVAAIQGTHSPAAVAAALTLSQVSDNLSHCPSPVADRSASSLTPTPSQVKDRELASDLTPNQSVDKDDSSLSHPSPITGHSSASKSAKERGVPRNRPKSSGGDHARSSDIVAYSSQRQKKLQKEAYLFLQENPHITHDEFRQHHPTVSVRSFYRWKQEIRKNSIGELPSSLTPQ